MEHHLDHIGATGPATLHSARRLRPAVVLVLIAGLLAAALGLAVGDGLRPGLVPDAGAESVTADIWLVTIADNDAGWVVSGSTSQWVEPGCRGAIEAVGGHFDIVEWAVLADTVDPARFMTCEEILTAHLGSSIDGAVGTGSPAPVETPVVEPANPDVWLVTIPENPAGWAIIDGTSQWVDLECRHAIEAHGGFFEVVEWGVLEATTDAWYPLTCDELFGAYFAPEPTVPTSGTPPSTPVPNEPSEPAAPVDPAPAPQIELVTIAGNDAGWAIVDGAGSWVGPQCRRSIEGFGHGFPVVAWAEIEATRPADPIPCDRLIDAVVDGIALPAEPEPEPTNPPTTPPTAVPGSPLEGEVRLARGINLAGDLEVTPRGSWGTPIEDRFFPLVAARGFDHVRIPIRWSAYTGPAPTYAIDPTFFAEVDRLVDLAADNGLGIVLDVHFFEALDDDPLGERDRFLAIWDQIARRYQDRPASVVFELLNEPVGVFENRPDLWNQLAAEALAVVRRSNPTRTVIIGPVSWNHASRLPDLELPADPNVVATIHTYDPSPFTHQGAVWVDPVPPTGIVWRPADRGVDLDWANRSWGVRTAQTAEGLRVNFDTEWSALGMLADQPARATELRIEADRAFDAVVLCNYVDGSGGAVDVAFEVDGSARVDVSSCGDIGTLALQSVSAGQTVTIERLALCTTSCDELIVTNAEALDGLITTAADWARNQGVPLYIGEFGVVSVDADPTDPQSRAAWTRTVRTSAERNGVGWAYFELNAEFGAWDRATGQWVPEIVDALFG